MLANKCIFKWMLWWLNCSTVDQMYLYMYSNFVFGCFVLAFCSCCCYMCLGGEIFAILEITFRIYHRLGISNSLNLHNMCCGQLTRDETRQMAMHTTNNTSLVYFVYHWEGIYRVGARGRGEWSLTHKNFFYQTFFQRMYFFFRACSPTNVLNFLQYFGGIFLKFQS